MQIVLDRNIWLNRIMLNNNTWNYLTLQTSDWYWIELLVLNSNAWNILELLLLDNNAWNHLKLLVLAML